MIKFRIKVKIALFSIFLTNTYSISKFWHKIMYYDFSTSWKYFLAFVFMYLIMNTALKLNIIIFIYHYIIK